MLCDCCLVAGIFATILSGTYGVAASPVRPAQMDDDDVNSSAGNAVSALDHAAFFETRIRPVIVERCLDCHSGDDPESGLNLESRAGLLRGGELGAAVVPGKPSESLLLSALRHDEFLKMPPREKLPVRQIGDFAKWIEAGALWPDSKSEVQVLQSDDSEMQFTAEQTRHWAFQPVMDPAPPRVNSDWPQSPIDQFIMAQLESVRLKPAAAADKRTLLRRATFDLTGLPPTPNEMLEFLHDDSHDAFAKVVDRLLASDRYGEHWGRHWLDVVRYADSNGLDENLSYANAFRYRDYVIAAFNSDKPYSRFVQEQIAGDLLPEVADEQLNRDRLIATGFLAIGPKMLAEDDPAKMQMDIIDEQIQTLGQAFMGLTIGCARCHDHKFDPLPTEDYYSLAGIFKSSRTMENHNVVAVWFERPLANSVVRKQIEDIDDQLAQATQELDKLKTGWRDELAGGLQRNFGRYLMAAAQVTRFQAYRHADHSADSNHERPFPVKQGFAVVEAEAFHRGNVQRLFEGYGSEIGITATSGAGFAEFDFEVERPGKYQLEIRHAAADSRPVKLHVNGTLHSQAVADQVTGSWYPDGQRWFVADRIELKIGTNTLRLESDKVHPHIDRIALVYDDSGPWPFSTPAPVSITQIAARFQVDAPLIQFFAERLHQFEADKQDKFPTFRLWQQFSRLDPDAFPERAAELLDTLSVPDRSAASTQATIAGLLRHRSLRSLQDVADVYQTCLDTVRDDTANKEAETAGSLQQEWFQPTSPLHGPEEFNPSLASADTRMAAETLQKQLRELRNSRPEYDVAMGITEAEPQDLRIHHRGSHIAQGRIAPRRFPRIMASVAHTLPGQHESGRLQLAQWLTHPDHPLVNRVMVNRIWHWHFGRGLSSTVDNFGLLGQPPTHPQLLDWLTQRFAESGTSVKQLHRLIMLSGAYRMSTRFDDAANVTDPANSFLWRFRRRRLTAEEMRDSVIQLGSGLDEKLGGSLLKVKNRAYVTGSGSNLTDEYETLRRSVYLPVIRSSVYDVLQTFDFPDPAVATGQRQTSTVAPQALMMMNSALVEQQTLALAERLLCMPADKDRITELFACVLNRHPEVRETELGLQYVQQALQTSALSKLEPQTAQLRAWQSYCRVLLSSNEFAYIE